MLKKRDAQGLSIQVIILVTIGLIVLVVLISIFSKETSRTVDILGSCEARGGECLSDRDICFREGGKIMPGMECPSDKKYCCYKVD